MLTVVCWKWRTDNPQRPVFESRYVNVLRNMVARHYRKPHRFVCVTDDAAGIDSTIDVVPLWNDHGHLPSPLGAKGPSCYRRLRAFAADAAEIFGSRFVSVDLDCVILGDLAPLWDRSEDFVMWAGNANGQTPYNGSMFMLTAGARPQVWDKFDPLRSPVLTKDRRMVGSDQAWIGYVLGPNEAKWHAKDGVLSFSRHCPTHSTTPPDNTRMVFFPGRANPWDDDVQQRHPWVRANWH